MKKGIITATVLFGILFALDLFSTLRLGELVQYLESNPLYSIGGLLPVIILNLALMFLLYTIYCRSSNITTRYSILMILSALMITRIFVVYNNFQVALDPPTVEVAKAIPQAVKDAQLFRTVYMNVLPVAIAVVTFILFKLDHFIKPKTWIYPKKWN